MNCSMAAVNVQSFLQHQLHTSGKSMLAVSDKTHQQGFVQSDIEQQTQLTSTINNLLIKAMREYGESRKFVEAKMDTYDYFWSRTIEDAEEIVLPFSPVTYESVGSRGEGLGFLANDTDIVTTSTTISACFPSHKMIVLDNMLVIETTGCHSGYCRLKFHRGNKMDSLVLPPECSERMHRDIFLTNTFNIELLEDSNTYNIEPFQCAVHGPALTNETLRHDIVSAVRCEQPHSLLDAYLTRYRTWPDSSILDRLRAIPCAVVTTSHPNSTHPSLEFRISFASAEKFLIRNFTDNQFACYGFLKIIKRRIESDDSELKDLLKSYYLKTALLWISEQLQPDTWTDQNFLYCTSICLSYLQHCLRSRNLPQLFQPENNLIDHLQPELCDKMANAVEKYTPSVSARVFLSSWCDDTFDQHFDRLLTRPRRTLHNGIADLFLKTSTSKLEINLISHLVESGTISFLLFGCTAGADSVVCRVLYQMITRDLDNIVKPDMTACMRTLLYRQLASIVHRQPRFVMNNNKLAEEFYKNSQTMVYPISGFDDKGLSGKTNLAFFHYLNGDWKDAVTILGDVENKLNQADINRALLVHFVNEDLPRLWRDPFLTRLIQTFSLELHSLPVKCNALAFYILARCIDELYNKGEMCLKRARLQKLKRSVLANVKRLSALERVHRIYTALVLDAAQTILTKLLA